MPWLDIFLWLAVIIVVLWIVGQVVGFVAYLRMRRRVLRHHDEVRERIRRGRP